MEHDDLIKKYERLKSLLAETEGMVVAYSGGVDSTLLLKVAVDVLNDRALAVIATSETYPAEEVEGAVRRAQALGARHRVIHTEELQQEQFARNSPDRCYHCKIELFNKLGEIAREEGLHAVADGTNLDDIADYRPGLRAGCELAVRSPLREAGLTKADIRALSKRLGLPTWNKPSLACLASRFPYGDWITADKLRQVAAAERALRCLGFAQLRVRDHDTIARIELEAEDLPAAVRPETRAQIVAAVRAVGYQYVALDLEGYRSGSMNKPLGRTHAAAERRIPEQAIAGSEGPDEQPARPLRGHQRRSGAEGAVQGDDGNDDDDGAAVVDVGA